MVRIHANDFGPNHGLTLFRWNSPEDWDIVSWQIYLGDEGHQKLRKQIMTVMGTDKDTVFLGERFLFLHEFRDKDKIDLTAPEYIGVAKLHCQMHDYVQVWQNAAQACGKTAFWGDSKEGNDKIRKLDLWQPNHKHAMDSLRHLLYYFTFTLGNEYFLERLK